MSSGGARRGGAGGGSRGRLLAGALLAVVLAAGLLLFPRPPAPGLLGRVDPAQAAPEGSRYALLALGDTGEPHDPRQVPSLVEGQLAVARALTAWDLARPADALVLLGDNFYPEGLAREALAPRIAENLVWPYCRFVDLSGPRSDEVRGACSLRASLRRDPPPRILAVLGNHDHERAESPGLEREAVPDFVPNWHVPDGLVEVVELAQGLSLALIDTTFLHTKRDVAAVAAALVSSRGPWRIVAAHKPALTPLSRPAESRLMEAVRASGVKVQLFLAGHLHNLQAAASGPPDAALHVIAGGGATRKPVKRRFEGRLFAREATGFCRVDLVSEAGREALVVTLVETPRYPAVFWRESGRVGRWQVGLDGAVAERP